MRYRGRLGGWVGVGVLAAAVTATAAPFQNLDFEGVILPHNYSYSRLMPHWGPEGGVANSGLNEPLNSVWYESMIVYDQDCALHIPFEGQYGLALLPSRNPSHDPSEPPIIQTLSQLGDLPADAGLLHFKNWGERVQVFLGDPATFVEHEVPITYAGDSGVGDISAYAGQSMWLKFRTLPNTEQPQYSALDSIWFSPIPEPSTMALLTLGAAAVGWTARRRQER